MKSLVSFVAILILALGCAGSIGKSGVKVVVGSSEIGEDCNALGECETLLVGNGFTEGFMDFGLRAVELAVGVVTFFIPSGFQPGDSE